MSGSWACAVPLPGGNGGGAVQSGIGGGLGQQGVGGGGFQGTGVGGGEGVGGGQFGFGGGEGVGGGGGSCFGGSDNSKLVQAWRPPPAVSGGTMVVLASGLAAIGDSDRDEVHFFGTDFSVSHVALQPGDEPGRVVEGPSGTVFVALRRASAVAQVDVSTGTVQRLTTCPGPRGLAWRADVKQLLVTCTDGELSTLDFSSGSPVLSTKRLVDDLRDVLVVNGQVLVTTFRGAKVYALDAQGGLSLWSAPVASSVMQAEVAWRTVASPRGLLMAHQRAQTTAVPEPAGCVSPWGAGPIPEGGGSGSSSSTLSPDVSALNAGQAQTVFGFALPNAALPVDVAVSADGNKVAVVFAGAAEIVVHDPTTPSVDTAFNVEGQPVSIAYRAGQLLVYSREPASISVFDPDQTLVAKLPLSALSMADTGHDLFHLETTNGIACASCHPEATDDGHIWNLPKGLRRTPSLRGGLKGTEPFHWDGEEATMTNLVSDVFVARMGGLIEADDHVAALLGWVDAQPKRAVPGDLDEAAVSRGAAQFSALGCTTCHSGALGTNNSSVDVGTGGAFQVPRLVEMAYRAPFFHDGHVDTLQARFTAAGGSAHTATQGLSADQVNDLVAYLKSR
ncbi:MAG: c-type cytochrome [Myxococcaceae bacterium]